jgi:ATP-binding cassette subfamily B protein
MKDAIAENRFAGMWRMMTGFRWHYGGAIASLGVAALARTGTLLLVGYFVDELLLRDDIRQTAPLVALAFIALAATQGAFSYLSGRWAAYTAESVAHRVRNYLFDHVQRLSFTYHDRMQTGELLQRCTSDLDAVRRFYIEQGVEIGRITLMFLVNFIAIMTISVPLALVSSIIIPFVLAISTFFFRRISIRYEEFQNQEAKVSTALQENLSGVRVVKAFARQPYEIDKFETENWHQFRLGRAFTMMHAFFWPTSDLLTSIQLMGGLTVGALMVIDSKISLGDYLAYAGMVRLIIFPIQNLGRLIVQTSTGLVSYDRVMEIIREERERLDETAAPPVAELRGMVTFDHVTFEYEDDTPVLRDISFSVEAGQVVALLGSTGSGKTSLVNLLPRFYDYTEGSIKLDGVELREYPRAYLRENIGIVEQEPFLFSRSIRENMTYSVGREVTDEEVEAAARAAAIHEVILSFPEGYSTMVGERGVTLSGGQKQRLVLARTLLKNPALLILDDATSSVDTETEADIRAALRKMMQNRTTFVIAHRIQTVMHADLVLVFDKGRIVQMGTHEELMQDEGGIYRRTYDMQSRIEDELEKELAGV